MKTLMKMRIAVFAVFCLLLAAGQLIADENKSDLKEVKIKTNAFCNGCVSKIEGKLNKVDGVKTSNLDLETKVVTVKYNASKTSPDKLRETIKNAGYEASVEKSCPHEGEKGCCSGHRPDKCCKGKKASCVSKEKLKKS